MSNTASTMTPPLGLAAAVPALPALLGLTGVGVGIYSFVSPYDAIRKFGLRNSSPAKGSDSAHMEAFQRSVIYGYGIRNVGVGLANLGLVAYWRFSPECRVSPVAALIVQKCLGVCLLAGTVVGLGDAWIMRQFAKEEGVVGEAESDASKASVGHGVTAILIFATGLFLFV
ncbi:hypothetical protein FZEAL_5551 [Fusarium zealandicum]|uniref:Uncharacterized protein n=1 Tax=Fusarium zealandicum TaxID=1053134 RepID=A0A8H4UKE8_9HYPO|nr:hypothetical protein FZEAL_5551 [Fusarium zealandicum]